MTAPDVGSVAEQAAGLYMFAPFEHRGQPMALRQANDQANETIEKRSCADRQDHEFAWFESSAKAGSRSAALATLAIATSMFKERAASCTCAKLDAAFG